MFRVTKTYLTDIADLAYQISRSDGFIGIRDSLNRKDIDDQEAQSDLLAMVEGGACSLTGDHGAEDFRWALTEAETGKLTSLLYRDYLGQD